VRGAAALLDRCPAAVVRFADMISRSYVLPVFAYIVELRSPAGSSFA
jgi:hypothetical protein